MTASRGDLGTAPEDLDVVMRAARVFSGVVAASMAHSGDVVTWPQLRALVLVATQPAVTTSTVAAALDVHPSSASRLCERLVKAGLVERATSVSDRRIVFLSLTSEGSTLIDEMMEHRRRAFTTILTTMSPSDRIALHHCLSIFADAAGEPAEPTRPQG